MSEDKIEEIRARYAGCSLNSGNAGKANEDRGWLLAEVERLLDAENERLREALEITPNSARVLAAAPTAEEIYCLRAANKGLLAEVERLRAALEYMVNVCPAIDPDGDRAHEKARKALEGKP